MAADTILTTGITSTDITALFVGDTTDFPESGLVIIDEEFIQYSSKSLGQLTDLIRGQLGTLASDHIVGDRVYTVGALNTRLVTVEDLLKLTVTRSEILGIVEAQGAQIISLTTGANVTNTSMAEISADMASIQTQFSLLGHQPVFHKTPSGAIDGNNTDFALPDSDKYVANSLVLVKNRFMMQLNVDYQELDPAIGTFRMTAAPQVGESLIILEYLKG